jgi:hypothetical protein
MLGLIRALIKQANGQNQLRQTPVPTARFGKLRLLNLDESAAAVSRKERTSNLETRSNWDCRLTSVVLQYS